MAKTSNMNGKTMAMGTLGLLAASSAGAALGMLFAPKPGVKLRQDLRATADDVAKKFQKIKDKMTG